MYLSFHLKDIKNISKYLDEMETKAMIDAIVEYVEDGVYPDFKNKNMDMIFESMTPNLDKSIRGYNEWIRERKTPEKKKRYVQTSNDLPF